MNDESNWYSQYQLVYDSEDHFQRLRFLKVIDTFERPAALPRNLRPLQFLAALWIQPRAPLRAKAEMYGFEMPDSSLSNGVNQSAGEFAKLLFVTQWLNNPRHIQRGKSRRAKGTPASPRSSNILLFPRSLGNQCRCKLTYEPTAPSHFLPCMAPWLWYSILTTMTLSIPLPGQNAAQDYRRPFTMTKTL